MSITVHQYYRIFPCSEIYGFWEITYYDESNWLQDGKGPKRGEIRPNKNSLFAALLEEGVFDNETNLLVYVSNPRYSSYLSDPFKITSSRTALMRKALVDGLLTNQPGMVYYGETVDKLIYLNTNHKAYKAFEVFCDTKYHFSITKKSNNYLENFVGGNVRQSEKAIAKIKEELDSMHIDLLSEAKLYLKTQG